MSTSYLVATSFLNLEAEEIIAWYDAPIIYTVTNKLGQKAWATSIPAIEDSSAYLFSIMDEDDELYLIEGKLSLHDAILKRHTFNFILKWNKELKTDTIHKIYLNGDKIDPDFLPSENYFIT